jgi:hypothetical protein
MKIETIVKSCANNTVKYGNGIRVVYDGNAVAEVSKADGEFLLETYAGVIFPEGKVVQPVQHLAPVGKAGGEEVGALKESLQRANLLLNDYKAQTNTAKANERVWRQKCEELIAENLSLKSQLGQPIETVKPVGGKTVIERDKTPEQKTAADAEALRVKLGEKTVKELISIAEELKLDKTEYQKLTKIKLIEYIIAKSNNG